MQDLKDNYCGLQPLECLGGQTIADFCLTDPDYIESIITDNDEPHLTLIELFYEDKFDEIKKVLIELQIVATPNEIPYDFYMKNSLIACFQFENFQITAAELLIKFILLQKRKYHHQHILMSILPIVLDQNLILDSLEKFFIDCPP